MATVSMLPINQDGFHTTIETLIGSGTTFSIAVVDLDMFVQVNREHGREVGDQVLAALGHVLSEAGDAYRTSGDEFAMVFAGVTLEQAFLKAEAVRQVVERQPEVFPLPMTVSVGIAQYPRDGKDLHALLAAADAGLLAAKESGRNQVALPPNEEMVMKSCYYPSAALRRLKSVAEKSGRKESELLREALGDLIRKYDRE